MFPVRSLISLANVDEAADDGDGGNLIICRMFFFFSFPLSLRETEREKPFILLAI